MVTRRSVHVDASPDAAFEAARRTLLPHIVDGAFSIRGEERPSLFALGWGSILVGSDYRFAFHEEDGGTTIDATMTLSGLVGPLHALFRRSGNAAHLDEMLQDIQAIAEGRREPPPLPGRDDADDSDTDGDTDGDADDPDRSAGRNAGRDADAGRSTDDDA